MVWKILCRKYFLLQNSFLVLNLQFQGHIPGECGKVVEEVLMDKYSQSMAEVLNNRTLKPY